MINLPSLESADVRNKRVFVRCDFDVPLIAWGTASLNSAGPVSLHPHPTSSLASLTAGARRGSPALTTRAQNHKAFEVEDDTRLVSGISTIEYLLEQGATVIAAGHLGRPTKQFSISNFQFSNTENEFSLEPITNWFASEFPGASIKETHIGGFFGWKLKDNFFILENLRFYKEEEENDSAFTHKLAYLADIYVNEAFGASHRPHASIVGVPRLLPHFAGFHFQKEIKILARIFENPKKPFTFIVGGAKIETKLPLISRMHKFADFVLVGGELAEQDKILIKEQHENITSQKALLIVADLISDKSDITQMSLENFLQIVSRSKTIIWNGPMGLINEKLDVGNEGYTSLELAKAIIGSSAYKVVGGGDTIGFLNKHGMLQKFDFVSMGGGAMLEFLSGESLPGLVAIS